MQNKKRGGADVSLNDSYGKISDDTGLRRASISEIINGSSDVKAYTLHLILDSLGASYTEFGKIMDKITAEEIKAYRQTVEEGKKIRSKSK